MKKEIPPPPQLSWKVQQRMKMQGRYPGRLRRKDIEKQRQYVTPRETRSKFKACDFEEPLPDPNDIFADPIKVEEFSLSNNVKQKKEFKY